MRSKRLWLKIFLPLLILTAGFLVMRHLVANRPLPEKLARKSAGVLVETIVVKPRNRQIVVRSTGTVQASQEVEIILQVSGQVVEMAAELVAGGFFDQGQLLFRVDPTDYQLAVKRARAILSKAKKDLALVESQARVARREWETIKGGSKDLPEPLVLYEPQMEEATANLAAAKASVKQAELDLARTRVVAPFNCRVRSEKIAPGQYVRSGAGVALLAAVDTAEIIVPLPLEELQWLTIPGPGHEQKGSVATAALEVDGTYYLWLGRVARSLGEIDPQSRMSRLVLRMDEPYSSENDFNLEVGLFVNVALLGETLQNVVVLPRKALRENSTVWLMDREGQLVIRPVTVARIEGDDVMIRQGLDEGDRVVLTPLAGAAEGLVLRNKTEEQGQ